MHNNLFVPIVTVIILKLYTGVQNGNEEEEGREGAQSTHVKD
jgi:hypothetical protein